MVFLFYPPLSENKRVKGAEIYNTSCPNKEELADKVKTMIDYFIYDPLERRWKLFFDE
jgi:hypothetical protein